MNDPADEEVVRAVARVMHQLESCCSDDEDFYHLIPGAKLVVAAVRSADAAQLEAGDRVIPGVLKRVLKAKDLAPGDSGDGAARPEQLLPEGSEPTVVTSMIDGSPWHAPVIDLDIPHTWVPSTTPGHGHLYLDQPMTWGRYVELLNALVDAGVVEPGYVAASEARGYTAVRLPWVKKEQGKQPTNNESMEQN